MTAARPLPGDFGVTRMAGDVGKAIRFGEWLNGDGWADVEHAVLYVDDGLLIEAEPGGARLAPWDKYGDAITWSTERFAMTPTQRFDVVTIGREFEHVPYSFADYAAIAAHRLHLPGSRLLRGYVASTKHLICSQLVDAAYALAGVHLFDDGRWPGYVTPSELAGLLK